MTDPKGKYSGIFRAAKGDVSDRPSPASETVSPSPASTLPLDAIKEREENTRDLRLSHVEALAESIAAIGLIEPLAVDEGGRLLAGGHRLAAVRLLKEKNRALYEELFEGDRIPVRVMPFDAEEEPELALQVEVAENEQRRDYTPAEVKALAERLKAAGYTDRRGRPAKGEKPLLPALEVIVGKSLRTLNRYLQENSENRTDVRINPNARLKKGVVELERWRTEALDRELTPDEEKLLKSLPSLLKLMQKLTSAE